MLLVGRFGGEGRFLFLIYHEYIALDICVLEKLGIENKVEISLLCNMNTCFLY